jgi:hypothetical protein
VTNPFAKRVPPPSPEEIRRACARIRRGWTEAERRARQVCGPVPWEAPVVPASTFHLDDRDDEAE